MRGRVARTQTMLLSSSTILMIMLTGPSSGDQVAGSGQ